MLPPSEPELLGRVGAAALLGLLLGLERELGGKPAGLRTAALVSVGAAAFTVAGFGALGLPAELAARPDVARIAAQVVSGIGFLGAGIILLRDERVRGLTTAAELWAIAAIGVLCGLGLLEVAGGTTGLLLVIVVALRPVERLTDRYRRRRTAGQAAAEPPPKEKG